MVPAVKPLSGSAARHPRRPPPIAISSASTMNDSTTEPPPKPSARRVAISRARAATAEYIVFSAPKTAPMAITKATRKPSTRISVLTICDCLA